jgi:hypothetical protein
MPVSVGFIMFTCLFCQSPQLQMEYNWTGLNVKLLAGCILLFRIGTILVSYKESRCSFSTLHERLYWASGAPSVIYWCAITIRQRVAVLPVLRALLLLAYTYQILPLIVCSQNDVTLHRNKRLAGSPVTKLIVYISCQIFSINRKEDVTCH